MKHLLFFLFFSFLFSKLSSQGLVINEFMASNVSAVTDQDGEYDDWIEIYNNTNQQINMLGLYLSDNTDSLKWAFPDTSISPNGFLVVWADENGSEEGLHANFKLSLLGEQITLYDSLNTNVLDYVSFGQQSTDIAFARVPNGTGSFVFQAHTQGYNNSGISYLSSNKKSDVIIYPNPTKGIINIFSEELNKGFIKVYNNLGQVIKNIKTQEKEKTIFLNNYPKGLYLVEVNNNYFKILVE